MLLYLLRHADAEPSAASDAERVLTEKGVAQAKTIHRFFRAHGIAQEVVLSSPALRAHQTAKLATEVEPIVEEWLASGMDPQTAKSHLRAYAECQSILLVGHEPDLSDLAAWLLGLESGAQIHLRKAALMALEVHALKQGEAMLEFSVPVQFM